jgi:hypothetical protein
MLVSIHSDFLRTLGELWFYIRFWFHDALKNMVMDLKNRTDNRWGVVPIFNTYPTWVGMFVCSLPCFTG